MEFILLKLSIHYKEKDNSDFLQILKMDFNKNNHQVEQIYHYISHIYTYIWLLDSFCSLVCLQRKATSSSPVKDKIIYNSQSQFFIVFLSIIFLKFLLVFQFLNLKKNYTSKAPK